MGTPGPRKPSKVVLLALALCVLGAASPAPRREISREQAVTSALLLRKALRQVHRKLLSHLVLEESEHPSICLPAAERSSARWYRYQELAGVRFCLYRKCLRRLERTLLRKYGLGLEYTPVGLGLLIGSIGKLSGASVSCGEPLDPAPAFWTSEVEGGVNVIRDLVSDLDLLVGQSDSLVSDVPT